MKHLWSSVKLDVKIQIRNKLYAIGIFVAMVTGIIMGLFARPAMLPYVIPSVVLSVIGGSTLLYIAASILFEKDEHTLDALVVSPMTTSEYVWAKLVSYTFLATIESVVMIATTMIVLGMRYKLVWPNIPLLLLGIVFLGILYSLIGIMIVVRYTSIVQFLVPMTAVVFFLQIPFFYFIGIARHWIFLLSPSSAPTMIIQGAYIPLSAGLWAYAVVYTLFSLLLSLAYARYSFNRHIISKR